MRSRWVLWSVLFALATPLPAQVLIKGDELGQGILRPRGGECYLLAPAHVVEGSPEVGVISEFRRTATARLETTYPGDLALLRVDDKAPIPCNEAWDAAAQLQARLSSLPEAILESRNEDGSLQRRYMRVTSFDPRLITVRPVGTNDRAFRGLSGSLLRIGGTPAGMLLRVDSQTGDGIVLRADHMSDVIRSFFDVKVPDRPVADEGLTIDPLDERAIVTERGPLFTRPDQLAGGSTMLEVGAVLRVTGRVRERLWYRVTAADGTTGFIPTRVVQKL